MFWSQMFWIGRSVLEQKVFSPDVLTQMSLIELLWIEIFWIKKVLNPKVEAAIEVGVEARSGVEVVPRLTVNYVKQQL